MRKRTNNKLVLLLLTIASYTMSMAAVDNAHFYKVARFHGDTTTAYWEHDRMYETADWLSKFDASYAYGSASRGWNNNSNKTSLLNIHGEQNMLYLFTNVVKQAATSPAEVHFANFLGNAINHSMTNGMFGQLEFTGKFEIHDFNLDWRQNLVWGLFFEAHLPIRDVTVKNIGFIDKSPDTGMFSKQNPDWKRGLNNLDTILANYGLAAHNKRFSKTDIGDLSILVGWDHIEDDAYDFLKWIRIMFKVGILFPTGARDDVNHAFSVSTGYNGHWGIPLATHIGFGIRRWLHFSVRGGATFFFDKTLQRRMKTHINQNGFIKLAKGLAEEEKGTLWHIGADLKLDHIFKGFSFLFGYSFNRQERDHLNPREKCCAGNCCTGLASIDAFDNSIVDSDSVLNQWYQHVLHFIWDYDFSVHGNMEDGKWAPRINLFYNLPIDGKNAFDTDMIGGGIGLDVRWDF